MKDEKRVGGAYPLKKKQKKKIGLYIIEKKNIQSQKKRTETFGLHFHNFYEFELVLSGEGKHILNGKEYPLKRGACWLTRLSDVHEGIVSSTIYLYNIQFAPSRMPEAILRRISIEKGNLVASLSSKDILTAIELCKALTRLSEDKSKEGEAVGEYILSALLSLFFRSYVSGEVKESASPLRIAEALSYIGESFRKRISLLDIAEALHTNKNYFCTFFKEKTGVSVMTYIRNMRLAYAERLLKTTELRVIDIAEECGYGSISHFLRDFKAKFGITPKEMRASFEMQEKEEKRNDNA